MEKMILAVINTFKKIAIKPEQISRLWTGFELMTFMLLV